MRIYHLQLPQEPTPKIRDFKIFQLLLVSPAKTKMQFAQEHHLDYLVPYQTFRTRLGDMINLNALFKQISLPNQPSLSSVLLCGHAEVQFF
jgi:hypothetical protein